MIGETPGFNPQTEASPVQGGYKEGENLPIDTNTEEITAEAGDDIGDTDIEKKWFKKEAA